MEGLVGLVLGIAIVGFLVWLVVNYIPMPAPFKTAIVVVVVIALVLYVLRTLRLPALSMVYYLL